MNYRAYCAIRAQRDGLQPEGNPGLLFHHEQGLHRRRRA
jgi:hypothetical protein